MERSSCLEESRVVRRSTSIRDHHARDEELNNVLQGESDWSQPSDTLTDDSDVRNDVWTIAWNCWTKRWTHTTLDVLLESRIDDDWNLMVARIYRSIGAVSRRSHWMKNIQTDTRRPTSFSDKKKFKQRQGLIIHDQKFGQGCRKLLTEEKNRTAPSRNRSSTMPESWKALISSIRMTWSSRTPRKTSAKSFWWRETCGEIKADSRRSKNRMHHRSSRIYETVHRKDYTKKIMKLTLLGRKGLNSLDHHILAHKFVLMRQAMKNPDAKAAVDKE